MKKIVVLLMVSALVSNFWDGCDDLLDPASASPLTQAVVTLPIITGPTCDAYFKDGEDPCDMLSSCPEDHYCFYHKEEECTATPYEDLGDTQETEGYPPAHIKSNCGDCPDDPVTGMEEFCIHYNAIRYCVGSQVPGYHYTCAIDILGESATYDDCNIVGGRQSQDMPKESVFSVARCENRSRDTAQLYCNDHTQAVDQINHGFWEPLNEQWYYHIVECDGMYHCAHCFDKDTNFDAFFMITSMRGYGVWEHDKEDGEGQTGFNKCHSEGGWFTSECHAPGGASCPNLPPG